MNNLDRLAYEQSPLDGVPITKHLDHSMKVQQSFEVCSLTCDSEMKTPSSKKATLTASDSIS